MTQSSTATFTAAMRMVGLVLRIMIGWHFLYEGIVKLLDPRWSSAAYLSQARWLFSGFFQWIATTPSALWVADMANIWGLVLIGSALILGLFTRLACAAGIVLLSLYFISNPPLSGYSFGASEGHYLFVNKNLIEMGCLLMIALFPPEMMLGLDRILRRIRRQEEGGLAEVTQLSVPAEENSFEWGVRGLASRRELLKNLTVFPVLGGFVLTALKKHGWQSFEEKNLLRVDSISQASVRTASALTLADLKTPAPTGTIGNVRISRLIIGGNLVSGFAHARDLIYVSPLLKAYFTDEKVMETLWLCESSGINTAILRTDNDTIRILKTYWKKGGKIQWLAQTYPKEGDLTSNIDLALDNGAIGAFVQGGISDRWVKAGTGDLLSESISYIKRRGVIAGTAGHMIRTVMAVETSGVEPDFYMKTLHHSKYWSARREGQNQDVNDNAADNYWEMAPEETIGYMENLRRPWIAYKVLAAGAIKPQDGFEYAFRSGADFTCVGMFDFQVVQNVNTLTDLFGKRWDRSRPWMA